MLSRGSASLVFRAFLLLLTLLSAVMANGVSSPVRAQDVSANATPEAVSGLYEIGDGRMLFLKCTGAGSPTVVLESGSLGDSSQWFAIAPSIALETRVCVYDRAGLGLSDPAPAGPRSLADAATDLLGALTAAGIHDQLILVGYSLGGMIAREFAATYPDQVAGMVLVEGTPYAWIEASTALNDDPGYVEFMTTFWSGLQADDPERFDLINYPPDPHIQSDESVIPVICLVRERSGRGLPPEWDEAFVESWQSTWVAVQEAQAAEELAELRVIPGTDHDLPRTNPKDVILAVLEVLDRLRIPQSTPTM